MNDAVAPEYFYNSNCARIHADWQVNGSGLQITEVYQGEGLLFLQPQTAFTVQETVPRETKVFKCFPKQLITSRPGNRASSWR